MWLQVSVKGLGADRVALVYFGSGGIVYMAEEADRGKLYFETNELLSVSLKEYYRIKEILLGEQDTVVCKKIEEVFRE